MNCGRWWGVTADITGTNIAKPFGILGSDPRSSASQRISHVDPALWRQTGLMTRALMA